MMSIKYDISNDPYKLDTFEYRGTIYPALTRKNADFINAVIKLDSRYKKAVDVIEPDERFNIDLKETHKYFSGSVGYWFNEMKKSDSDFVKCVYGAIISLDRADSTHLNTCVNGRESMLLRICDICKDKDDLIKELNKSSMLLSKNHIFYKLAIGMPSVKDETVYKTNISFVSKFLFNASFYLRDTDNYELAHYNYPKYDGVVSESLWIYGNVYRNLDNLKMDDFRITSKDKTYDDKLKKYYNYMTCKRAILDNIYEENRLTLDEFDNIVWYLNK